jgi:hypothetical protein
MTAVSAREVPGLFDTKRYANYVEVDAPSNLNARRPSMAAQPLNSNARPLAADAGPTSGTAVRNDVDGRLGAVGNE